MTRNDEMACFVSVDSREEKLTALSKEIWEYAEPGLKEKKSSAAIAKFLEEEGFRVQLGVGTVPTAICFIPAGSRLPVYFSLQMNKYAYIQKFM